MAAMFLQCTFLREQTEEQEEAKSELPFSSLSLKRSEQRNKKFKVLRWRLHVDNLATLNLESLVWVMMK